MPFIKDNGQFRFTPDEDLTASQIKSYFSYVTRRRRKQVNESQRLSSQSVATNNGYRMDLNDSDEEIDEENTSDYDSQVAAEQIADFQQIARNILKK
ncbi:unnamed protein product [Rotaria sp. Silwood2]|nr:unnamed protein product [Rotaria sp. Silwood2]CAF2952985.1 unnamed protein product [Rotaria sp. Silwood2]CAF3422481.1 unnamed protein product [Rotaria sp. Silwood2]CAF4119034.1 unnamed protein product [Rotaria sp. Silwood2]CAF4469140.1 unnamed protein product [Rotaria sp. Silwood2]